MNVYINILHLPSYISVRLTVEKSHSWKSLWQF